MARFADTIGRIVDRRSMPSMSSYLSRRGSSDMKKWERDIAPLYSISKPGDNSTMTARYRLQGQTNSTSASDPAKHCRACLTNDHNLMRCPMVKNSVDLNNVLEMNWDILQKSQINRSVRSRRRGDFRCNDSRNEADNDKKDILSAITTNKVRNTQTHSQGSQ